MFHFLIWLLLFNEKYSGDLSGEAKLAHPFSTLDTLASPDIVLLSVLRPDYRRGVVGIGLEAQLLAQRAVSARCSIGRIPASEGRQVYTIVVRGNDHCHM
ncbi:MAG: hypothetical protein JXA33_08420 [Anaerolineae bacterium]|nr:hypothetical protein [Anaerolineae bacterium]